MVRRIIGHITEKISWGSLHDFEVFNRPNYVYIYEKE
jgi:hypothetical protein